MAGAVEVLREWPSVAELLPRYPAVWDVAGQTARYPHELPIDRLRGPAARAYALHEAVEVGLRSIPRGLPDIDARLGWSHPTPRSARWQHGALTVGRQPPTWLGLAGWDGDRGDGTVPAFSAVPLEASRHSPVAGRVRQRHAPLGSARFVAELVEGYERYADLGHVRDGGGPTAAIGLDLESEHDPAAAVAVRAVWAEKGLHLVAPGSDYQGRAPSTAK